MIVLNRQNRVFETGITNDHENKRTLYSHALWLYNYKSHKSTLNKYLTKYNQEIYQEISFDNIKRGSLLLFAFGLFIAIIGFALELAKVFRK